MKPREKVRRPRRAFPRTLAECVEPVTKPAFRKGGIAHMQIIRDWNSIVGAELAGHTQPVKVIYPKDKNTEGVLTLRTSGGFATEIQHLEPYILEKIAGFLGYRAIARLRIEQGPSFAKASEGKAPTKPKPVHVEVADPELKEALTRLAHALQSAES